MYPNDQTTQPPPNYVGGRRARVSTGRIVLFAVLGGLAVLLVLCGIAAVAMSPASDTSQPAISTTSGPNGEAAVGASAPPAPESVTVKGRGNTAKKLGAVLNGPFTVEYSFSSFCGIVNFLKSDGSEGAGFMEGINECAADINANKVSGSAVVNLESVTMVEVENTQGNWTLKFTPLG